MKSLVSILTAFQQNRRSRSNLMVLLRMLGLLAGLISLYAVLFHVLMEREGQQHSWLTGFYWTLTVMTTLGFGDITFHSDLGRAFSIAVMMTGVMFLLVLLPFTFIEFFYAPWIKAQESARAPRKLPADTRDHVILIRHDPMAGILLPMLADHGRRGWVLTADWTDALALHDRGVPVVTGDPNDHETWRNLRVDTAAMVVAMGSDVANTNVTFTVRQVSERPQVVASTSSEAARDALELAGVNHILRPDEMMGNALARRVIGSDATAHVIGELEGLIVAEAGVADTGLAGMTLAESGLRTRTGVTVAGLWDHGHLKTPGPESRINDETIFLLAGSQAQIDRYNEVFRSRRDEGTKVVIVGSGLIGRATARALDARGIEWRMIERFARQVADREQTLVGEAADFDVLVKAGLHEAGAAVLTSHDDEMNLFLTIFYRQLRRNLRIICRCSQQANVAKLHRAGADLVLSQASMTANTIYNFLSGSDTLLLAEGLYLFPAEVPPLLAGLPLAATRVRERTGCSILAVETPAGRILNPEHDVILPAGGSLVLIGSLGAETRFHQRFPPAPLCPKGLPRSGRGRDW